jgi:hypothetical protein
MSEIMGQRVVVENVGGAGGMTGSTCSVDHDNEIAAHVHLAPGVAPGCPLRRPHRAMCLVIEPLGGKRPMQIAPGRSDIWEFESSHPSHGVRSLRASTYASEDYRAVKLTTSGLVSSTTSHMASPNGARSTR